MVGLWPHALWPMIMPLNPRTPKKEVSYANLCESG